MTVTTDPFKLLARLEEEIFASPRRLALPFGGDRGFKPLVEVKSQGSDVVLSLELPGVDPDKDLDISLERGRLSVSGERRQETEVDGRSEFFYGSFRRDFSVPETVAAEDVEAAYDAGVLKLTIRNANAPASEPAKISVKASAPELTGSPQEPVSQEGSPQD